MHNLVLRVGLDVDRSSCEPARGEPSVVPGGVRGGLQLDIEDSRRDPVANASGVDRAIQHAADTSIEGVSFAKQRAELCEFRVVAIIHSSTVTQDSLRESRNSQLRPHQHPKRAVTHQVHLPSPSIYVRNGPLTRRCVGGVTALGCSM
jgi:hypothetical protein